jgi:ABC-type glycerol-3-phosphate transport system substrate-binding protein
MSTELSRRNFLKAAAMTGIGIGLAACKPKTTEEAPVEISPTPEPVTITVWGWWEDRMKFFQQGGDRYKEKQPNVTVTVTSFDQDFWQKVFASVPAGTGPTLCKMITQNYFKLKAEDMVIELDPVTYPDSFLKEKFPNHNWQAYGRYVMPEGEQTVIFTYNKKMMEEAGLDPNKPPKTWDVFFQAAQKMSKADSNGTLTVEGFAYDDWLPFHNPCFQKGGQIIKHEGDTLVANFDSPEMEAAMQFFVDLAQKYKAWDKAFPYFTDAIGNRQAATSIHEAWGHGVWQSDFPEVYEELGFDVPPTPTGEAAPYYGRKNMVLGLASLINRPESEIAAGQDFLEYFYKEDLESQLAVSSISGLVPAHAENLVSKQITGDPFFALGAKISPKCYDIVEISDPFSNLNYTLMDMLFVDNQSIKDTLAFGQAEMEKMIAAGDITAMY